MKITIDTIKKELVIEDTTSVPELIEFLKNYEDYTVVNKTVLLNNPVITNPYRSPFGNKNIGLDNFKTYCEIHCGSDKDVDIAYPYPATKIMYNN